MSPRRRESRNGSTPTVLLVHGAFADASGWSGVIAVLHSLGIDVIAPANPLRGLPSDARYIASVAEEIDGPTVLVGHSYGGAVITVAGSLANNVIGLVYVSGFALDEGESILDVSARFPDSLLASVLRPAAFADRDGESGVELYVDRAAYPRVFAADLPAHLAAVAAGTQRPITQAGFEDRASAAAWRTLPSWYVLATADRVICPEAQRFMAVRAGATTLEVDSSHSVATSQPALVADQIRLAALTVRRTFPDRTSASDPPTRPILGPTESEHP
ncbi:MAG: alpha/beta fold hydrolase [Solirubrobacteraceae bacterium]